MRNKRTQRAKFAPGDLALTSESCILYNDSANKLAELGTAWPMIIIELADFSYDYRPRRMRIRVGGSGSCARVCTPAGIGWVNCCYLTEVLEK